MITATYRSRTRRPPTKRWRATTSRCWCCCRIPRQRPTAPLTRRGPPIPSRSRPRTGAVRIALVGAGGFAKGMHLPNLQALGEPVPPAGRDQPVRATTPSPPRGAGARAYAGTDYQQVLDDPEVDAVIIATRHNLHATMALAGAPRRQARPARKAAGAHPRPSSTTSSSSSPRRRVVGDADPADRIQPPLLAARPPRARMGGAAQQSDAAQLPDERRLPAARSLDAVGRGRRPQPRRGLSHLRPVHLSDRRAHRAGAGGGDPAGHRATTRARTTSRPRCRSTTARWRPSPTPALGSKDYPKERLEVFVDGKVIALDDYKSLTVAGGKGQALPDPAAGEGSEGGAGGVRHGDPERRRVADSALGAGPGDADRPRGRRPSLEWSSHMCGIVGALVFENGSFTVTEPYIRKMRDTMVASRPRRRRRLGLPATAASASAIAGCRSSTCRPSANQPMANEDGTLQVVFNGEIYNHAEIRAELEAIGGHRWRTDHSDTEVILHAFEEWGIDCLAAVPRHVRHRAVGRAAARRCGWSATASASSRCTTACTTAASRSPPRSRRCSRIRSRRAAVNEDGALPLPVVPDHAGARDAVRRHPQAAGRHLDARRCATAASREQRYWDVWDHVTPLDGVSEDEIAERILDELRTAVKLRKVSDVPVGVFLSGGIDSSTNAALFSEGEGSPVKTFIIGYEGEYESYQNELHYARDDGRAGRRRSSRAAADPGRPARTSCRRWCSCRTSRSPIRCACRSTTCRSWRATTASSSARSAKGADELFWGYPTWKTKLRLAAGRCPARARRRSSGSALAGAEAGGQGPGPPVRGAAPRVAADSRCSGAAPRPSPTRRSSGCCRRGCAQQFDGLTSWEALAPIWQRFQAEGLGAVAPATG